MTRTELYCEGSLLPKGQRIPELAAHPSHLQDGRLLYILYYYIILQLLPTGPTQQASFKF